MKVGMYYNNSDVRLEEIPVPKIGSRDILLKVVSSGICGSDIMEWYRIKRAPLVLGHELTGEIVETGKEIKNFHLKDRIFATHHVPCDECTYCLNGHTTACETFQKINNFEPGGFSQFLRITGRSIDTGVLKLPDSISYEQGSFIEPLGTVVRGFRTASLKPGNSLLVMGSGIVGLLMIKLARAMGAGKIFAVDVNEFRLSTAKRFGADGSLTPQNNLPEKILEMNQGRLVDIVMICTGALSACTAALPCVDRGGTIVFFAVPNPGQTVNIDFNPFWRNDVSIKTCYGAAPLDNREALEILQSGKVNVDDMVTHRFSLADIGKAFQVASSGKDALKVMIEPNK